MCSRCVPVKAPAHRIIDRPLPEGHSIPQRVGSARLGEKRLTGERVERRLAAILAADVAGYSRLMGEDEAGTLARLKAIRRELIDPEIAEHKGRVVKTS